MNVICLFGLAWGEGAVADVFGRVVAVDLAGIKEVHAVLGEVTLFAPALTDDYIYVHYSDSEGDVRVLGVDRVDIVGAQRFNAAWLVSEP